MVKRVVYIVLGCIALGIGCAGIVLPFLPAFPFFLATVFFFARSSPRLHDWFLQTPMYKKHLESYVKKKGMTIQTKRNIILTVTLLMGFGFLMMKKVPAGRVVISVVWLFHIIYFVFGVKTLRAEDI